MGRAELRLVDADAPHEDVNAELALAAAEAEQERAFSERERKPLADIAKGPSSGKRAPDAQKGAAFLDAAAANRVRWPEPLDLMALAEREPEAPRFLMPDWLPVGYATLMAGHGGVGKSGIALHLAACLSLGLPFFGLEVQRSNVLYLSCEDREGVLHWRLARICRHLGIDLWRLAGALEVLDLVGHEAVLWERDPLRGGGFTAAFGSLQERVAATGRHVIVVDGISDTYGGSGASKTEVKRYVNGLVGLVPADRGAVVLVGHIDKKAAKDGAGSEGYDGTTGWHNSVRARWYLRPETASREGETENTGDLLLELQKSNLGVSDASMRFAWNDEAHLFIGQQIGPATRFDRAHRDREEQRDVLRAMGACAAKGIEIPAATSGKRTTLHVLAATAEFPASLRDGGRSSRARFWRCVESLRQSRALVQEDYVKKNRHPGSRLVLTPEGMRQCAE